MDFETLSEYDKDLKRNGIRIPIDLRIFLNGTAYRFY
jgi:hypothetical protein